MYRNVIKELCVMCVQTKQFYTFHICPSMLDANMVDLEDPKNKYTLELGIARHGMSWCAGTEQFCDVREYLHAMIPKDATYLPMIRTCVPCSTIGVTRKCIR